MDVNTFVQHLYKLSKDLGEQLRLVRALGGQACAKSAQRKALTG
jgi:hypothetical protein